MFGRARGFAAPAFPHFPSTPRLSIMPASHPPLHHLDNARLKALEAETQICHLTESSDVQSPLLARLLVSLFSISTMVHCVLAHQQIHQRDSLDLPAFPTTSTQKNSATFAGDFSAIKSMCALEST